MSGAVRHGTIRIHDPGSVARIRESARIVARCLRIMAGEIRPGVSTLALDRLAEEFIRAEGGEPAFKGYRGFPASICASVNEEVVHGIPSATRVLREGDVISVDIGVRRDGFYGDAARTYPVGEISPETARLLETTERALDRGIEQARPGNHVTDISHAVEREVRRGGYGVVKALVGHGIGRELHEEPQIPNYGPPGQGPMIRAGMVFAIEPMVNQGTGDVVTLPDQWTVVTADRKLSAHFEHTVVVGPEGAEILTRVDGG
ncbi:MAG TPA: type I methionyl aminopeptidase [Candidatus Eisenbacteria bacterium]